MKKFRLFLIMIVITLGICLCIEKVNATIPNISASSKYSITRVYRDPIWDIYKVTTPTGTFEILWESSKGGLCILK
jgi:hypothetical protein